LRPEIPLKKYSSFRGYSRLIIGKKAKISENPMKEIKIAAEEDTSDVASIATPAPVVAY